MDIFGFGYAVTFFDRVEPEFFSQEEEAISYIRKQPLSLQENAATAKWTYYQFKAFQNIQTYATPFKHTHIEIWNAIDSLKNEDLKEFVLTNLALINRYFYAQDYFDYIIYAVLRLENSPGITDVYSQEYFNQIKGYKEFIDDRVKEIQSFSKEVLPSQLTRIYLTDRINGILKELNDKLKSENDHNKRKEIEVELDEFASAYRENLKQFDNMNEHPLADYEP